MHSISLVSLVYVLLTCLLTLPIQVFSQEEGGEVDTSMVDTWEEDSLYDDEYMEEAQPETVKEILKSGADNAKEVGKQAINDLTTQAVDGAGQLLRKGAENLFSKLADKLKSKKRRQEEAEAAAQAEAEDEEAENSEETEVVEPENEGGGG